MLSKKLDITVSSASLCLNYRSIGTGLPTIREHNSRSGSKKFSTVVASRSDSPVFILPFRLL